MKRVPRVALVLAAAWLLVSAWPAPAAAQFPVGRLTGTVRDIAGRPVKDAAVFATNPSAVPQEFKTSTDRKGQWAILGLRSGTWQVSIGAEGFEEARMVIPVSVFQPVPPLDIVLVAVPARGPLDGVDTKRLQADLASAEALVAQAKWDDAVAAYRLILARVPALDSVNLAIGRALRSQKDFAGAETAYGEILRRDSRNQKALLELGRTQHERGDSAAAIATLDRLVSIDAAAGEAAEARELLAQIRK